MADADPYDPPDPSAAANVAAASGAARWTAQADWAADLADVTRRYLNLCAARPRTIQKIYMLPEIPHTYDSYSNRLHYRGVSTWNRRLEVDDRMTPFDYPDPMWSYSREDGLLLFPGERLATDREEFIGDPEFDTRSQFAYVVLDVDTGDRTRVPFDVVGKAIRRVRLAEGVVVIEWADAEPYRQFNGYEDVHRHYATAFDVVRFEWSASSPSRSGLASTGSEESSPKASAEISVAFRSEWTLHPHGLPINRSDRFFSTHTATHYAVYTWQPNTFPGPEDQPLEQLSIWDISSPCEDRPSLDGDGTGGGSRADSPILGLGPSYVHTRKSRDVASISGPRIIRRMTARDLDFYRIRQGTTPILRNLAMDDRNLYIAEESHRLLTLRPDGRGRTRSHLVMVKGIPIVPGPAVPVPESPEAAMADTAASVVHRPTPQNLGSWGNTYSHRPTTYTSQPSPPRTTGPKSRLPDPVQGPHWFDCCGNESDVDMSFCRRAADRLPTCCQGSSIIQRRELRAVLHPGLLPQPQPQARPLVRASSHTAVIRPLRSAMVDEPDSQPDIEADKNQDIELRKNAEPEPDRAVNMPTNEFHHGPTIEADDDEATSQDIFDSQSPAYWSINGRGNPFLGFAPSFTNSMLLLPSDLTPDGSADQSAGQRANLVPDPRSNYRANPHTNHLANSNSNLHLNMNSREDRSAPAMTWVPARWKPASRTAEGWPGRAPCWRHESFPFLTLSEMVDEAAGVRISARRNFMLEAISVHVQPELTVHGPWIRGGRRYRRRCAAKSRSGGGVTLDGEKSECLPGSGASTSTGGSTKGSAKGSARGSGGLSGSGSSQARKTATRPESGMPQRASNHHVFGLRRCEASFDGGLWGHLMAKGHIAGDERFLIGEDFEGNLTILEF